jgi:hypothetical protein
MRAQKDWRTNEEKVPGIKEGRKRSLPASKKLAYIKAENEYLKKLYSNLHGE